MTISSLLVCPISLIKEWGQEHFDSTRSFVLLNGLKTIIAGFVIGAFDLGHRFNRFIFLISHGFWSRSANFFAALTLIFIFALPACTDKVAEGELSPFHFEVDRYSQVILLIDEALRDHERKVAFYGYAQRDHLRIKSSLQTARGGLLTLVSGGDPHSAYLRLSTSLHSLDETLVLDRDQDRLDQIFNSVRWIFDQLSRELGYENQRIWNLYNYNFSQGIEPEFRTFGSFAQWGYNFLINIPKASVGGRNGANAWLVSRAFDLREVQRPSFRFDTLLMVDSRDQTLDRIKAIREVFKVYLVFDSNPLEDLSQYNDSQIEQMEQRGDLVRIHYDPADMPLGENFHRKWVPSQSLESHKDRPFAIAFRFDPPSRGMPQYHMWQIYDVEINGAGLSPENPIKFSRQFTSGDGDLPLGFHAIRLNPQGDSWQLESRNQKSYMTVPSGEGSEAILLSPKYYIRPETKKLDLHLFHTFSRSSFAEGIFDQMKVLISDEYKGGDPQQASWQQLDYSELIQNFDGQAFVDHESIHGLDRYIGREITLAFWFRSQASQNHQWRLNGFFFKGEGGEVAQLFYNLGCFEENIYEEQTLFRFDLDLYSNRDTTTRNLNGSPPSWTVVERDTGSCFPKQFYEISGHQSGGSHQWGETRKILPVLDLSEVERASFRFLYSLNFWNDPSTTEIQISRVGSSDWQTLTLPRGTLGTRRNNYWTQWISIPPEFVGRRVQFAIKYHSFQSPSEQKPNLEFKRLEVKKDDEEGD
jgi:hypothetical protein